MKAVFSLSESEFCSKIVMATQHCPTKVLEDIMQKNPVVQLIVSSRAIVLLELV